MNERVKRVRAVENVSSWDGPWMGRRAISQSSTFNFTYVEGHTISTENKNLKTYVESYIDSIFAIWQWADLFLHLGDLYDIIMHTEAERIVMFMKRVTARCSLSGASVLILFFSQ